MAEEKGKSVVDAAVSAAAACAKAQANMKRKHLTGIDTRTGDHRSQNADTSEII